MKKLNSFKKIFEREKQPEPPKSYTISFPKVDGRTLWEKTTSMASKNKIGSHSMESEESLMDIIFLPCELDQFLKINQRYHLIGYTRIHLEKNYSEITLNRGVLRYASEMQRLANDLETYLNSTFSPKPSQSHQEEKQ